MMNEEVTTLVKDSHVMLGKISASCSGIHQASDVSPLFRSAKTKVRTMTQNEVVISNYVVETILADKIVKSDNTALSSLSSGQRGKIVNGCLLVSHAIQEVMRPKLICDGFVECGQYPLSFEKVIHRCYGSVDETKLNLMKLSTDEDVIFFREHGYLSEEKLKQSGVDTLDDENSVPRDARPLQNQRAVLISHPETRSRYIAYKNRGLPIGNLLVAHNTDLDQKTMRKAVKVVASVQNRQRKQQEEAVRKASLTAEQKRQEAAEKKAKTASKKREKEEEIRRYLHILNMEE
jgi:DNA polymerase III delta prime subunit